VADCLRSPAGEDFVREIPIALATISSQHDVLAGFWARGKIDELMSQDWGGMQSRNVKPEVQKEITPLGLDYRLMTQFTSFVAVADQVITNDGKPQRVEVPVEMPEGVSREGVFGLNEDVRWITNSSQVQAFTLNSSVAAVRSRKGSGARVSAGSAGGVMGDVIASPKPGPALPPPPPPAVAVSRAENQTTVVETKLTPERKALESKLHPAVLAAFDCAAKAQQECKLVDAGKVEVQLFLTQKSANVVDQLSKLGFGAAEGHSAAKMLRGCLPVEKLQALAQIAEVRFVSLLRR
jgi:Ca-activated chloride channel homolog